MKFQSIFRKCSHVGICFPTTDMKLLGLRSLEIEFQSSSFLRHCTRVIRHFVCTYDLIRFSSVHRGKVISPMFLVLYIVGDNGAIEADPKEFRSRVSGG